MVQNRRADLFVMVAGTVALIGFCLVRKKLEQMARKTIKGLIASEGGIPREAADQMIGE